MEHTEGWRRKRIWLAAAGLAGALALALTAGPGPGHARAESADEHRAHLLREREVAALERIERNLDALARAQLDRKLQDLTRGLDDCTRALQENTRALERRR